MANQHKPTTIQRLNPTNKDQEKERFFFDPLYNPQFEYEEEITDEQFEKYGPISDKYLSQAKQIIETVIKQYGSEEEYIQQVEGKVLSREAIEKGIQEYLKENELERKVSVVFSTQAVARTSVHDDQLIIRLPLEYGENILLGMLNHEIGTHYFRTLNERQRAWYKQRKSEGFGPYIDTEEGLAILHHFMFLEEPLLWRSALYYYACWFAQKASFSELNKELEKYVKTPERRWKTCIRIKRGMRDTSKYGAFSHDQLYLSGLMKVLQWLEMHEYDPTPLYLGKVGVQDVAKALRISGQDPILLPHFLRNTSKEDYKKKILYLKKINKL